MKSVKMIIVLLALGFVLQAQAQGEMPKGYSKGSVVLSDGSLVSGAVKEKIRSNASLTMLTDDNKKKNYDGSDLLSVEIGDEKFVCIKGDFFKVLVNGEISFLQKSSDASYKPIYNGSQAVFANGTPGSPGDYFFYRSSAKQLTLLNRKTMQGVAAELFAGCEPAIASVKAADEEVKGLGEAVSLYNQCTGKSIATEQK